LMDKNVFCRAGVENSSVSSRGGPCEYLVQPITLWSE
jgi:hypothetical protein